MHLFETLRTSVRSLLSNKTRSALTMLGVVIGTAAVIAMVALGTGANRTVQRFITGVGSNLLIIHPKAVSVGGARQQAGSGATLTLEDAEALEREAFALRAVTPDIYGYTRLVHGNRNWSALTMGTGAAAFDIRSWRIAEGRFFLDEEAKGGAKVAVLGDTVARNLFDDENPLERIVRIRNVPMRVIGVLAPKGQTPWGQDQDDVVYVPFSTAQRRLFRRGAANSIHRITAAALNDGAVPEAERETTAILRQRRGLADGEPEDFEVRNMTQMLDAATESTRVMSLLLGAVASISLLVGGIGIMNIMLVSVTERTREIGIRMAVGARPADIRAQFLTEAVLLSVSGGVVGIALGAWGSSVVTRLLEWPTVVSGGSIALAFSFSVFVGVFFGFYPAWKASTLHPMEALGRE